MAPPHIGRTGYVILLPVACGAENSEGVYKSMGGRIKPHSGRVRASQRDDITRVFGRKWSGV